MNILEPFTISDDPPVVLIIKVQQFSLSPLFCNILVSILKCNIVTQKLHYMC